MKLAEIAERINKHLKRFEADPKINYYDIPRGEFGTLRPYYHAGAFAAGPRIKIKTISYQCGSSIKKDEALKYLEWLDAGNIGDYNTFSWKEKKV